MKHTNSLYHGHQSCQHGTIPSSTFNLSENDNPYSSQIEHPMLVYKVCRTWGRVTTTIRCKSAIRCLATTLSESIGNCPYASSRSHRWVRNERVPNNNRSSLGSHLTPGHLGCHGDVKQVVLPHYIKVLLETSSGIPFYFILRLDSLYRIFTSPLR